LHKKAFQGKSCGPLPAHNYGNALDKSADDDTSILLCEQVVLDVNERAVGRKYCQTGSIAPVAVVQGAYCRMTFPETKGYFSRI
jgi:hypothetical protein